MVSHSSRCGHSDRCDHAQGTAQAVVPEKADTDPGSHRLAEWSSADHVHLSLFTRSTGIAIGDSWLPSHGTPGVGRDIPGHPVRSECRRVARLPGKVKKDGEAASISAARSRSDCAAGGRRRDHLLDCRNHTRKHTGSCRAGASWPVSAHGQPLYVSCPRELRAPLCDCPSAVNKWHPDL